MLALTVPAAPFDASSLLIVAVVAFAALVLLSVAVDLRRLRRAARLRTIHGVLGAVFTIIVVGGALSVSMALGSAPSAIAGQQPDAGVHPTAPIPESIDTSDITDPSTDIQLPTLPLD